MGKLITKEDGMKYAWVRRTQPVTRVASRGRSVLVAATFA